MLNDNTQLLNNDLFFAIVDRLGDGIMLVSEERKLVYANVAAKQILGLPDSIVDIAAQELVGELFGGHPSLEEHGSQTDSNREEVRLVLSQDSHIWLETTTTPVQHEGQCFLLLQLRDIGELKNKEVRLYEEATTDHLSGLANRRQFRRLLDQHADDELCLAVVDVDHFKRINDNFGHLVGDSAIRFVAEKLVEFFADAICVSRLGGEEFGVVLSAQDRNKVEKQFEEFRVAVASGAFFDSDITLTVSIGLAYSAGAENDIYTLLVNADKALYESKDSGRNRLTVHND